MSSIADGSNRSQTGWQKHQARVLAAVLQARDARADTGRSFDDGSHVCIAADRGCRQCRRKSRVCSTIHSIANHDGNDTILSRDAIRIVAHRALEMVRHGVKVEVILPNGHLDIPEGRKAILVSEDALWCVEATNLGGRCLDIKTSGVDFCSAIVRIQEISY